MSTEIPEGPQEQVSQEPQQQVPEQPQEQVPEEPQEQAPEGPQAEAPAALGQQERTMGMLCHLLALAGYIGIPLGNIIGPLVIWLIKKDQIPFANDQGKESLNFQISVTIYAIVSSILIAVVIGMVLLVAVWVFGLVMVIIASLQANQGIAYRYPLTIRFIK